MKILIADSFPQPQQQALSDQGHQITLDPALDASTLANAIADHEILIVRSTKVTGDTLSAATNLKLVIRAGAGTNTIDKAAAAELDIRVCNVPGANAVAVAELAMGLIISLDRNIPANCADLKQGTWNKKKYSTARGLYGQKIGILGLGAIGFAVAERAAAFGMPVFTLAKPDRTQAAEKRISDAGITQLDSLDEMLSTCDIISLHMPANEQTTKMVDATFLHTMKEGAMLINTSRGELIDEAALIDAMQNRGIRAGLDVYENEPRAGDTSIDSALATHESTCGTHHIGASTQQAQTAVSEGVLEVIAAYANGEFKNCVN